MFTLIKKDETDFDPHRFKVKVNERWVRVPPRAFPIAVLIINHPGINLTELRKMLPNMPEQTVRNAVSEIRSAFLECGAHVEMGYFIRARRAVARPVTPTERDNYEWQIQELKAALNKGVNIQYWPGLSLSGRQSSALSLLYTHEAVTDEALLAVMPAKDAVNGRDDVKLLHVEIAHLRKKLRPVEVEVMRTTKTAYYISSKHKAILADILRNDKERISEMPRLNSAVAREPEPTMN